MSPSQSKVRTLRFNCIEIDQYIEPHTQFSRWQNSTFHLFLGQQIRNCNYHKLLIFIHPKMLHHHNLTESLILPLWISTEFDENGQSGGKIRRNKQLNGSPVSCYLFLQIMRDSFSAKSMSSSHCMSLIMWKRNVFRQKTGTLCFNSVKILQYIELYS